MKKYRYVSLLLVCVAVALIIVGALNGGTTSLFQKSAAICLECIGIG